MKSLFFTSDGHMFVFCLSSGPNSKISGDKKHNENFILKLIWKVFTDDDDDDAESNKIN